MTDYPRQTGPAPKAKAAAESAYSNKDDDAKPPTVRVPIRTGKPGPLGTERMEEIEAEIEAAQHWDDRIWNSGQSSASSPFGPLTR